MKQGNQIVTGSKDLQVLSHPFPVPQTESQEKSVDPVRVCSLVTKCQMGIRHLCFNPTGTTLAVASEFGLLFFIILVDATSFENLS